jgi:hypothetical protein
MNKTRQNKRRLRNSIICIGSCFKLVILRDNSFFSCSSIIKKLLQNWGNYADMSQGVAVYMTYASDVLLICWFGTQLTQHVRDDYLFYSRDVTYTIRRSFKELRNLTRIEQSLIFSTLWPSVLISFVRN